MKKILVITGSHRSQMNSYGMALMLSRKLKKRGVAEVEIIELSKKEMYSCCATAKCVQENNNICTKNDDFNALYKQMIEADGIVFILPKYAPYPSRFMILLERLVAISFWGFKAKNRIEEFRLYKKPTAIIGFAATPTFTQDLFLPLFNSYADIGFDFYHNETIPGLFINTTNDDMNDKLGIISNWFLSKAEENKPANTSLNN